MTRVWDATACLEMSPTIYPHSELSVIDTTQETQTNALDPPRTLAMMAFDTPPNETNMAITTTQAQDAESSLALCRTTCSWQDVLDSMETARQDFDSATKKSKGKAAIRYKIVLSTLQSLTEMIPDQDGLSVMRGGLKMIFSVLSIDGLNVSH
jgi:hypothetical protein